MLKRRPCFPKPNCAIGAGADLNDAAVLRGATLNRGVGTTHA